jgi:hypothetical protein
MPEVVDDLSADVELGDRSTRGDVEATTVGMSACSGCELGRAPGIDIRLTSAGPVTRLDTIVRPAIAKECDGEGTETGESLPTVDTIVGAAVIGARFSDGGVLGLWPPDLFDGRARAATLCASDKFLSTTAAGRDSPDAVVTVAGT